MPVTKVNIVSAAWGITVVSNGGIGWFNGGTDPPSVDLGTVSGSHASCCHRTAGAVGAGVAGRLIGLARAGHADAAQDGNARLSTTSAEYRTAARDPDFPRTQESTGYAHMKKESGGCEPSDQRRPRCVIHLS
jgi:hypothetical protein